ncbi:hypothetical protein VPNG_09543 [Cytospora leucostoma]|uniref:Uncharacterized protein n=1 Tax=Cytospora leucostoma TaxID=1230097 RepID=A0A423VQD5_9PEZI|nr:hypothetical protein VPNG_09543 [Cytospora leucostoma]
MEESKVQVHNFPADLPRGHRDDRDYFNDARDLNEYLSDSPQQPVQSRKRLIVIEGLEPRMLEVIGVKFGVPPSFFLGHCDLWTSVNIVDRACAKTGSTYWRVQVPQTRSIEISELEEQFGPDCYGFWTFQVGNVDRSFAAVFASTVSLDLRNLVSYWGMENPSNQGDWTAIVLVDPHSTKIRRDDLGLDTTGAPALFDLKDLNAESNLFSESIIWQNSSPDHSMGSGIPSWRVPAIHRNHRSTLFNEIASYFHDSSIARPLYSDPFSATEYVRNFIRSAWEESIFRAVDVIRGVIFQHNTSHDSASRAREVEEFQVLMGVTVNTKNLHINVREVMRAFHCVDDDVYRNHLRELLKGSAEEGAKTALSNMEWEAHNWAHLQETIDWAEEYLCDHMERYSQRAALIQAVEAARQTEEANKLTAQGLMQTDAANRMARSSAQLTKIATVIVPCSFLASIFSMGGEFAAGERLFFVYWVISTPVTLSLLLWVICGDRITDAWKDTKEDCSGSERRARRWTVWRKFVSRLWTSRTKFQVLDPGSQEVTSYSEETGPEEV